MKNNIEPIEVGGGETFVLQHDDIYCHRITTDEEKECWMLIQENVVAQTIKVAEYSHMLDATLDEALGLFNLEGETYEY